MSYGYNATGVHIIIMEFNAVYAFVEYISPKKGK